jgi:hypothetical protein
LEVRGQVKRRVLTVPEMSFTCGVWVKISGVASEAVQFRFVTVIVLPSSPI